MDNNYDTYGMTQEEIDQYVQDGIEGSTYPTECEFYGQIDDMKVSVKNGDVYIDGEFVQQLCWNPQQIGNAIAWYIASHYVKDMDS